MKKIRNTLWGIVLIVLGVIIGGNALGITNVNIFFNGWWTLFIIIPCFIGLFKEREKTGSIIGLIIGIVLLLCCQDILNFDTIWKLALPTILIIIGIFMLDIIKLNIPKINIGGESLKKKTKGSWGALLLGILFALAFCPTSGVFYFGMLMPLSAAETGGYLLPVIYAIATGLPVILVAWILAYSVAGLGKFYNRVQIFEKWFRKIVAILFIAIGIYYAVILYL